jgi:hypothetical protein
MLSKPSAFEVPAAALSRGNFRPKGFVPASFETYARSQQNVEQQRQPPMLTYPAMVCDHPQVVRRTDDWKFKDEWVIWRPRPVRI